MNPNIKDFFNFSAFIALFIGSFYFMYRAYTEIIGLSILSVTNGSFLLFMFMKISDKMTESTQLGITLNLAFFSILIGLLFTFISLLFTISMIYTTQQKYTAKYGTSLILPEPYHTKVDIYKRMIISCYCLVAILIFVTTPPIIKSNTNDIIDNWLSSMKIFQIYDDLKGDVPIPRNIKDAANVMSQKNGSKLFAIATSLALLVLSSYVIYVSNDFLKLNRRRISA